VCRGRSQGSGVAATLGYEKESPRDSMCYETDIRRRAGGASRKERPMTQYFHCCQSPTPAKDLFAEFWRLEKEAEKELKGLAK